MWPTLATAIDAVAALPYVEVSSSDPFDGEILGHTVAPFEVTLHQMRLALDLVTGSFKRVADDLRTVGGDREDLAEWGDAHDWHAMIVWFTAIVAAADCFHLDESDLVLVTLRNCFPREQMKPWPFCWQSYG
jgi:hypothetical protein